MQLLNSKDTWQVWTDFPEVLQFIAFIGQQEGFQLPDKAKPGSVLEEKWQRWWSQYPDIYGYNPPDFNALKPESEIRALYLKHQAAFLEMWRQTQMPLVEQLHAQLNRLELQKLIKICQKEAGLTSSSFELKIAFVWWPTDYKHNLSQRQLMLGIGFLEEDQLAELSKVVKDQIKKLI